MVIIIVISDWDLPTSFFHAAQTLLTVGYGVPFETNDWSWLFSTFYIIWGSVVYGGFVANVFNDFVSIFSESSIVNSQAIYRDNHILRHVPKKPFLQDFKMDILFYGYILLGSICAYMCEEFDTVKSVRIFPS